MLNESVERKISKGEYDLEFDKLSAFLFEQYKEKKQADSIETEEADTKVTNDIKE